MPLRRTFVTLVVILAAGCSAAAQDMIFPGTRWTKAVPESQGVDSARLATAVEYLRKNTPHDGAKELKADGQRKWPDVAEGTYSASGHNNNDMFVIPAWNMVVVRLGLDERKSSGGFPITDETYGGFLRRVGEAITNLR